MWISVLAVEPARPAWVRDHSKAWVLAVATVCFGAFMGQLDASIVTLTYGPLGAEFGQSLAAIQWVSLSYLLTLAALLVPVGRLADVHGRKLLYLYGFVVFTLASAACGLASDLGQLIAFRVVQGAGAALLQANSVALITTSVPPHRLRAGLGVQAAAQALGLALGPTVGGLLVSTLGWRWVFGINVPVGVVALAAGLFLLPRTRRGSDAVPRGAVRGDAAGFALLVTATTAGLLGLSALSGTAFPVWVAVGLFALAVIAGAGLVVHSRRVAHPLIDPSLMRSPTVRTGLAGALCGYLILFGPLVLVPVVLTSAGMSEMGAGLVLTALPAGFALAATSGEALLPRGWDDRRRCLVGAVAVVVTTGLLTVVPASPTWLVPVLAALGIALGTFVPANNSLVMGSVPRDCAGTAGGMVNMARSLGTALGVAFVTLALHRQSLEPAATGAAHTAALPLAATALVLLVAAWLVPGASRRGGRLLPSPLRRRGAAATPRPRGTGGGRRPG